MNIAGGIDWIGLAQATSGDGAITVTGAVANVSSGAATGSASLTKRFMPGPGDKITIKFVGRRISGSDATSGGVALNFPGTGQLKNRIRVTSADWREYSFGYTVPLIVGADEFVEVTCGVFTSDGGEIELQNLIIDIENTRYGAPRLFCCGLMSITNGTAAVSTQFTNSGISSATYSSVTKNLSVTLYPGISTGGVAANPIFFAQPTPDTYPALAMRVGEFNKTTGVLTITFTDTTTGAEVDMAGGAYTNAFYFSLMGIF